MKKIYIIAGEASGDLHASELVKELKRKIPGVSFRGFGGDKMISEGVEIVQHYREIAFMGFKEVAKNFRKIKNALNFCKQDIKDFHPDAVIFVDYPGFNLRIAGFAKKSGIKTFYYISPQIWAWKEKRIRKIRKNIDHMICILPFEQDFYKKHGFEVEYFGNPLVNLIDGYKSDPGFKRSQITNDGKTVAVLPGSRIQEVELILPVVNQVALDFPELLFLVAGVNSIDTGIYSKILSAPNCRLIFNQSYEILSCCDAGIIKSGTSTLEAALFGLPQVVVYKTSNLNYLIMKSLAKVKYISLVNLIPDKKVVEELIQNDFNHEKLKTCLSALLFNEVKKKELKAGYKHLRMLLENENSYVETASFIAGRL